jgi:hypothetical protein
MKNFDKNRFGHVLKLDFAEGLKPMLWGALCMLLLNLFFFWFAHSIAFHNSFDYMNQPPAEMQRMRINVICEAVGAFGAIAMLIYFLVAASTLYRSEQKKQKRIALLMLPATNLEKFLSRLIYWLVFSLIGGLLTFFVADLIHIGYLAASSNPIVAATPEFFQIMPHPGKSSTWLNAISIYAVIVATLAFFLMGGVLFRKYHFIVTAALVVILGTLYATLFNSLGLYKLNGETAQTVFETVRTVTALVAIPLFTWLAYRLFCRWQVVTHKFVNL